MADKREFREGFLEGFSDSMEWNKLIQLFDIWFKQKDYDLDAFFELFREFSQKFGKELLDKEV